MRAKIHLHSLQITVVLQLERLLHSINSSNSMSYMAYPLRGAPLLFGLGFAHPRGMV